MSTERVDASGVSSTRSVATASARDCAGTLGRGAATSPIGATSATAGHLLAVLVGVAVLVLAFGYDRGAVGAHAIVWFGAGNAAYWAFAVALAVRHRDNRAFCKLACPVAVILRTTSRPALLELAGRRASR